MDIINNKVVYASEEDISENGVLIVPYGVEIINRKAFFNNNKIEKIYLPLTVKEIQEEAFCWAKNLKNIYFYGKEETEEEILESKDIKENNNLEKIGTKAFYNTALKSFCLNKSLKFLGERVFVNSALKEIDFDENSALTEFDFNCFSGCYNLKEITFPESVKVIKNIAEEVGKNLELIRFKGFPKMEVCYEDMFYINNYLNVEFVNKPTLKRIKLKEIFCTNNEIYNTITLRKDANQYGEYAIKNYIEKNNKFYPIKLDEENFFLENEDIENRKTLFYRNLGKYEKWKEVLEKYGMKNRISIDVFEILDADFIEDYVSTVKKNKIWRNIERKIYAYVALYPSIRATSYLSGFIKLGFMLGVFSEDQKLSQKASDYIYSNVLKENNYYCFSNALIFNKTKFYKNKHGENYYNFIRENFTMIKNICDRIKNKHGENYEEFINYINFNFDKICEVCKNSKTNINAINCLRMYEKSKYDNINEENIDIYNELKKYIGSHQTHVDYMLGVKQKMIKNKTPEHAFKKFNGNKNLLKESELEEGLKGSFGSFSYEWLNKYKTNNVTHSFQDKTGCANIFDLGFGIVLAGMSNENCQNVRIFDKTGHGMARATVVLNKEEGTMLFNTFAVYGLQRDFSEKKEIAECFKKAVVHFIKEYEKNFPNNPKIKLVQVGSMNNGLFEVLDQECNKAEKIKGFDFFVNAEELGEDIGTWGGDWTISQYKFLTRKEINKIMLTIPIEYEEELK